MNGGLDNNSLETKQEPYVLRFSTSQTLDLKYVLKSLVQHSDQLQVLMIFITIFAKSHLGCLVRFGVESIE